MRLGGPGRVVPPALPGVARYHGDKIIEDGLHAGWFERIEASYYRALDAFVSAVRAASPPRLRWTTGSRPNASPRRQSRANNPHVALIRITIEEQRKHGGIVDQTGMVGDRSRHDPAEPEATSKKEDTPDDCR